MLDLVAETTEVEMVEQVKILDLYLVQNNLFILHLVVKQDFLQAEEVGDLIRLGRQMPEEMVVQEEDLQRHQLFLVRQTQAVL
jgi:hypothetical protein|tara:strand:+ start:370 stop:618 length:249 start_codon:yes stop_codon:yes gene_type:complete